MTTAQPPRGTTIPPLPPLPRRTAPAATLPPPQTPVAAPFEVAPRGSSPAVTLPELPATTPELLFDARREISRPDALDETWVGTLPAKRTREDNIALAKKLVLPALACIAAGIALGFYVSANKTKTTAPATAASMPTTTAPTAQLPAPSAPPTETVLHPRARSLEGANAGTSTAGGELPEPPTKEEQAAQMAMAVTAAGDPDDLATLTSPSGTLTHDAPADAVAGMREVSTPKGVVTLTDIRIDTDPQGASITLVDGGKQFPLGSTPLSTSLDASREYDVIVEMAGRPSQMVHLDPSQTSRLDISLGRKVSRAASSVAVDKQSLAGEGAKADHALAVDTAKNAEKTLAVDTQANAQRAVQIDAPAKALASSPTKSSRAAKSAAKVESPTQPRAVKEATAASREPTAATEPADADGEGVLMVSSKPPCEILIDGKATGLTTPQRAIDLPSGRHKITFVNKDAGIKETFTVSIKPGEPTKLIRDFLDRK